MTIEKMNIILVEDDQELREVMVEYLTMQGYRIVAVGTAREFYRLIDEGHYSLAILDIGLPDQEGLVLAEYVRKNTDMRIIILTARVSPEDRIAGYEAGADNYMVKPVDVKELALTIGNLFSRIESANPTGATPLTMAGTAADLTEEPLWRLDRNDWSIHTPHSDRLSLTAKEYDFMKIMARHTEEVVPRQEILRLLGYPSNPYGNRALESMLYRLRQKIEVSGCPFPVKTYRGVGYCRTMPIRL